MAAMAANNTTVPLAGRRLTITQYADLPSRNDPHAARAAMAAYASSINIFPIVGGFVDKCQNLIKNPSIVVTAMPHAATARTNAKMERRAALAIISIIDC